MWIARDATGDLYLYSDKPTLNKEENCYDLLVPDDLFLTDDCYDAQNNVQLCSESFPEVTFENSPIELKLNL